MTRRSGGRGSGLPAADPPAAESRGGASSSGAQAADVIGIVAGYRVLRRIGSGYRSDVYLGASAEVGADGQRDVVVLKVFRDVRVGGEDGEDGSDEGGDAGVDAAIDREVRALDTIRDGGVGRLLDIATLADGRVCLVLAEDRGGSLGPILSGERLLDPGEAVTILAPVLAALARLYDRGWIHPGIGPGLVRFDGAGRPVVGGLGGLRDLPPPGQARDELLDEARCACGDLVQAVLDRVEDRGQPANAALFAAWRSGTYREALVGLERALFEWCPAAPVRIGGHELTPDAAASVDVRKLFPGQGRLVTRLEAGLDTRTGPLVRAWALRVAGTFGRRLTGLRRGVPVSRAHRGRAAHSFEPEQKPGRERASRPTSRAVSRGGSRPVSRPATRRGTWRAADDPARRRRRGLILTFAFVVAILLLGAWTVLAPPAAISIRAPSSVGTASPWPFGERGGGSAADPSAAPGPGTADEEALQGDDPVAATVVLLRARALCLVAADPECLTEISQPDSPALAEDRVLIGHGTGGAHDSNAQAVDGSVPTVVDRIGNLALVALSGGGGGAAPGNDKPASVLVVKGEAGWRLREFFGAA